MECPACGPSKDYDLLYNCNQCGNSYCQNHLNNHGHKQGNSTNQGVFSGQTAGTVDMETMAKALFGLGRQMANQMNYEPSDEDYERFLRENPRILTTGRESLDLLAGILLIAWVFGFQPLVSGTQQLPYVLVLTIIIAPAFILHELAHKYMAIYYGKYARFAMVRQMAFFTFLAGLIGIPIAGPGATMILGRSTEEESGIFSAVGPLTNFVLSGISYILFLTIPSSGIIPGVGYSLNWIFMLSAFINGVLGVFNLIPFGSLDGAKVLRWNSFVWLTLVAINIPTVLISYPYLFV